MTKMKMLVGSSAAFLAALSTFSLAAGAQPIAVASGCKVGSESSGCKLNGTGYADFKGKVFVGLAVGGPRSFPSTLTLAGEGVCAKATGLSLVLSTKQTGKVGGSISFAGKAKVQGASTGAKASVKSAKITARLQIASAKRATLSGHVEAKLTDGSTCTKKLSVKMLRVLGG